MVQSDVPKLCLLVYNPNCIVGFIEHEPIGLAWSNHNFAGISSLMLKLWFCQVKSVKITIVCTSFLVKSHGFGAGEIPPFLRARCILRPRCSGGVVGRERDVPGGWGLAIAEKFTVIHGISGLFLLFWQWDFQSFHDDSCFFCCFAMGLKKSWHDCFDFFEMIY